LKLQKWLAFLKYDHQNVATNIRLWVDMKLDKIFFFQQEPIASTSLQKSSNI
jgi:glucuronate isomerase